MAVLCSNNYTYVRSRRYVMMCFFVFVLKVHVADVIYSRLLLENVRIKSLLLILISTAEDLTSFWSIGSRARVLLGL